MSPEIKKCERNIGGIVVESDKVYQAFEDACRLHDGQLRKSQEPYINHCIEVFKIIYNEFGIRDEKYLIAALLHDTVEDTKLTLEKIKEDYGQEVADLVDGVTKLKDKDDMSTLAKVIDKSYLNPGVAIIKLADRLHNMRTLEFMSPEKQIEKSTETLNVYTKMAESLGMWEVKTKLEDLCFMYLDPIEYQKTKKQIDDDPRLNPLYLANIESKIEQLLDDNNLKAKIENRKSGYWALKHKQEKLALKGKCSSDDFSDINDVVSIRVRLGTVKDCYDFCRILHESIGENVDYDRYDEFIGANKKDNGYQAIQTTVNFSKGPVEIAMVTDEIEEFNNWGVVYLINKGEEDLEAYSLKLILTPSGGLRFMDKDATGVDFAASISTKVLNEAKDMDVTVDGEIKTRLLSSSIPNASIVKINTGESRRAPLGGLEEYALLETRKIIKEQRDLEKRGIKIENGKKMMEEPLSPRGLLDLTYISELITPIINDFGCETVDDLYFLVGNNSIKIESLDTKLDQIGISKSELGLSTIRLIGEDHPGILLNITKRMAEINVNIVHSVTISKAGLFNIQMTVKGLEKKQEDVLRESLKEDKRFSESIVV